MRWLKWSSHEIPPKKPIPSIHSFYWAGIVGGVTSCVVNLMATNYAHSCDHSTRPTVRKIIFTRISVTLVSQASQRSRAVLAAHTHSHRCNFPAQLSVFSLARNSYSSLQQVNAFLVISLSLLALAGHSCKCGFDYTGRLKWELWLGSKQSINMNMNGKELFFLP